MDWYRSIGMISIQNGEGQRSLCLGLLERLITPVFWSDFLTANNASIQ